MILRLHAPPPPLGEYVELFTWFEHLYLPHSIERLLPEGVVEVIFDLSETPKHIYDNATLAEKQACRRVWVSGMRRDFLSIENVGMSPVFVLRFRPGMVHPFLQLPISALTGQVVDADLILGKDWLDVREMLWAAPSPEAKFACMEAFLLRLLRQGANISPVVAWAVRRLCAQPHIARIADVVKKTGYSHKHFLKLFNEQVGLPPKQFLQILKFQQAIQLLEKQTDVEWSHFALDCGYYDQAHFINDFRRFSGFAPEAYLRAKSDTPNYIPVR